MADMSPVRMLLDKMYSMDVGEIRLMEVCGTHTMAIAKNGIKSMLPPNVKLISGPGCPVCVTPNNVLDSVIDFSLEKDIVIATYGDMIRIPGSKRGVSIGSCKAKGADIEIVYSALDAVETAEKRSDKQVVFLGAGFETTAPGTALAILEAKKRNIRNFSVFSMLKTVEPALRALIAQEDFNVSGFLCPGHVATIIGEEGFEFLAQEYKIPSVISGFEGADILTSVYKLMKQIEENDPRLENEYTRAVARKGNPKAKEIMDQVFEAEDTLWRGLGKIPKSGLKIKSIYSEFDAVKKFDIRVSENEVPTACRCADVIKGKIEPKMCPMFAKACTPENPSGPCMVSSEGACAAEYKYNY